MDNFEGIIEEYGDYLIRVAYTYLKEVETAEEVVQDVFFTFYQKHQFEGKSSLRTYLVKMVVNRCHDYLRKKNRRKRIFAMWHNDRQTNTPEQETLMKAERKDLLNLILTLPIKYREVIVLHYYQDYEVSVISKILNCPESTIRTRLLRAKSILKRELTQYKWEVLEDE